MARRLTTIAREINDELDGFTATVEKVSVNTDRKVKNGGRSLRVPGKGRTGSEITVVHDATGRKLLRHNSGEAYRTNDEVENWVFALRRAIAAGVEITADGGTLGTVDLSRMAQDAEDRAKQADAVLSDHLLAIIVEMLQRGLDGMESRAAKASRWDRQVESRWKDRDRRVEINELDMHHLVALGLVVDEDNGSYPVALTPKGIQAALGHVDYKPLDIRAAIEHTLDLAYFHPAEELDGEVAIPAIYKPGSSKVVLVLGENAGGKSFFRRLMSLVTHRGREARMGERKIEPGPFPVREFIPLSMQARTGGGFGSSMVYGDEDRQSTGECSSRTVTTGIRTVSNRTHPTIIWWDEPDIGMSAGAAAGAGLVLRNFAETESPLVQAICVTSHSVPMIRQLAALDPHYLYLGNADGPKTLDEWFEVQQNPEPVMPDQLQELSLRRYRMIQKILNRKG